MKKPKKTRKLEFIETKRSEDTNLLGQEIAKRAKPGMIFALVGDLGVGKTVFTKGFAAGLGIKEAISSPTFTLVNEYHEGKFPFYHFDVYRIEEPEEMEMIGFEEYIYGQGVTLIEWANRIPELLPPETVWITIEKDYEQSDDYRKITIDSEEE